MSNAATFQNLTPDIEEAERFFRHIAEIIANPAEPELRHLTLQTFSDRKELKKIGKSGREYDPNAEILHCDDTGLAVKTLVRLQRRGAGVFFMVNQGDGQGRTAKNVIGTRAVFADLDGSPLEPVTAAALSPQIVVESSPGRYHAYYLTADMALDQFTPLQKALAAKFNGDKSVNDLPRVMRVPGFWHMKKDPFQTKIISLDNAPPYTVQELVEGLGLEIGAREKGPVPGDDDPIHGSTEGGRTEALVKFASSLLYKGMAPEVVIPICETWDANTNRPPLEQTHPGKVAGTVQDISRRYHEGKDTSAPGSAQEGHTATQKAKDPSQADMLVRIGIEELTLFHDENRDPFANVNGQNYPMNSKEVKYHLSHELFKKMGKVPNANAVAEAVNALSGNARFNGEQRTLYNRVAEHDGYFWYDLGDHRSIRTSTNGWTLEEETPVLFRRYGHQQVQADPTHGGDPWRIFDYMNIGAGSRRMLMVTLITYLIPGTSKPIIHPYGAQGSGKTFVFKIIKATVDPSSLDAIITPKDDSELIRMLQRHHVPLFDNMSRMDTRMSDILCSAVTGGATSKRVLYSDDEDFIYRFKRAIGINGINLVITKPDLLDRTLLIHMDRIDPKKRKDEQELWKAFTADKAGILGGMLDTVVKARRIIDTVRLSELPRLADFGRWGYAVAEALEPGGGAAFIAEYFANVRQQTEEVIQGSTLCQAVIAAMSDRDVWETTTGEAYERLKLCAPTYDSRTDLTMPKDAKNLKRSLERVQSTLAEIGIAYNVHGRTADGYPITRCSSFQFLTCQCSLQVSTAR